MPPELPAKSSHGSTANLANNVLPLAAAHHGGLNHGSPAASHGTVAAVPAIARLPPPKGGGEDGESLADAFSTEMLAWYEQKQNGKATGSGAPGKPATLV